MAASQEELKRNMTTSQDKLVTCQEKLKMAINASQQ
jgi:hypothetical protein